MPYTFGGNWFSDAPAEKQRELQDRPSRVLAKLHAIPDAEQTFGFLSEVDPRRHRAAGTRLARRTGTSSRSPTSAAPPLVERALAWLEDNFPADVAASPSVLAWGDSRIGNVLYEDFHPVAVLDWEMATVGPRELDVSWIIFAHMVFQESRGWPALPGLPDVMREEDVARPMPSYRRRLGDLRWFYVYSGVIWCCRLHAHRGPPGAVRGDREARRRGVAVPPRAVAESD